jgi:penicillin-binding protein 2
VTEGKTGQRLKILAALVAFLFAALMTRLWFLQVLASEQYREQATRNGIRLVAEEAPRGRIFDRSGNLLVGNRQSLVVTVNRQEVAGRLDEVLFSLSQVLEVPVQRLLQRMDSPRYFPFVPVPVAFDVEPEVAFYLGEHQLEFPGVKVREVAVRSYEEGDLAAHILGYTGEISPQQLEAPEFGDYDPGDTVGQSGMEQAYERYLRGEDGTRKYQINAAGETVGEFGATPPVPGDDVVLTIDLEVQRLAEESLELGIRAAKASGFAATGGAVVVMDPDNGQILALASAPTYDPAVFLGRLTVAEERMLTDPARNNPLFNRATQGEYPPGSAFKPFVALSALREGVADTSGFYECSPTYMVPQDPQERVFSNWELVHRGFISVGKALEISCDTVFYRFGYEYWRRYFPPDDPSSSLDLQSDLRAFGFDRPSLIDIPFEQAGRIPDPQWKATVHAKDPTAYPDGDWFPGDFINMSIGQGDTLVTPLQLAVGYSAIANGGKLWVPHVALTVERPDGTVVQNISRRSLGRLPFKPAYIRYVREALTGVTLRGTASSAFSGFPLSQIPVAGKTGTAEMPPRDDASWFAAMAPAFDPQFVVVAIVEQGGHGSTTSAPVVRRILEGMFGLELSDIVTHAGTD